MTLAAFFAEQGTTGSAVALAVGVSPDLFTRVDQRRQPLPTDLAAEIAALLGVPSGSVVAAAHFVGNLGPAGRIPNPPQPLLGDPVPAAVAIPSAPGPVASSTQPFLFVAGDDLDSGTDPGALVLKRNTGEEFIPVASLPSVTGIIDAALADSSFWVFGNGFSAQVGTNGVLAQIVADAAYNTCTGVTYSAEAGLWVCTLPDLVQVDTTTGLPLQVVSTPQDPIDAVAVGSRVYVTSGIRLLEIDSATGNTLRTSTGDSLRSAAGVTYDPSSDMFWVVSRNPTRGLFSIPRTSFAATEALIVFLTPNDFEWVEVIPGGDLYVTMNDGGSRLIRLSTGGMKREDRTFGGAGTGRVSIDADGGLVWFANPGDGTVHGMAPTLISSSAVTYSVGGAAPVVVSFRA